MREHPSDPKRIALNEARLREVNETIEAHNASTNWVDPPYADWVCECAVETCAEPVRASIAEYEAVRADATHFLVAPSPEHVIPEVERVVVRTERFWVVEKDGKTGELSEDLDPRADE